MQCHICKQQNLVIEYGHDLNLTQIAIKCIKVTISKKQTVDTVKSRFKKDFGSGQKVS